MPMPPLQDILTILVTTSPKRSSPKVIVCDGVRQRHESTTQKYTNAKQAMRHGLVTLEQNQSYEQFKENLRRLCDEATKVKIGQKNAKNNNNNYKDTPPSPICNTTDYELMQQQTTNKCYNLLTRSTLQLFQKI
jgi:hypothetical protein